MPDDSDSRRLLPQAMAGKQPWLLVEIAEDAGDWTGVRNVDQLVQDAAQALGAHTQFKKHGASEACIALSNDASVKKLNATYRGKDKPTNVLSFPAPNEPVHDASAARPLGDIVLALETVLLEAREQDISPAHHLQHLVIHGLLHLLGFDHETDDEAEAMEALETEILASIGIANPYAESVETA